MRTDANNKIYFAKTLESHGGKLFAQHQKDKIYHSLITGATGTGKSNLLKTMILGEIENNAGSVIVFDPNGDLVHDIIGDCSPKRRKDIILIDPSRPNHQYGYNPLKKVPDEHKHRVVSEVMEIFSRLYPQNGARADHILRHCLYLLLEQNHASLADIPKLLVDDEFRYQCRLRTNNETIQNFWLKEFPKYRSDAILPILSQLGFLLNHPAIRSTVIEPKYDLHLRHVIDNKKIILIAISKGKLGSDVSAFIGSILLTSLTIAVYGRANMPEWKRPYSSLYIDEFQNFNISSIIGAFAEVRKYGLAMTVATQRLSSLKPEIAAATIGNVGSLFTFRVSYDEARVLAKYMMPRITAEDIVSLPNYHIALSMMINGTVSIPFIAMTATPKELFNRKSMDIPSP
ncbi:MAG: type IV secretion system DNA-binding domain-containing protein [bacterium]|nr:type IV secretion system DNA-binding domain-containing protein [bacterium]